MNLYIVRVWVDLKIKAISEAEAKKLAEKHSINVDNNDNVEEYDSQVAEVWEKENETVEIDKEILDDLISGKLEMP